MNLSALFEPALLLFTLPMLVATAFGALSLVGLLDLEALDLDVDLGADLEVDLDLGADLDGGADLGADATAGGGEADVDIGAGSGGLLALFGLGLIPLSLLLVIISFGFGWIGLLLVSLFGSPLAGVLGGSMTASLVLAVPALLGALGVASPLARLLQPLFQDYGRAPEARRLVGTTGTVSTGSISPTFGSVSVVVPGRGRIEISARATDDHASHLTYGDRIVIYDFDSDHNVYYVAPFDEDELL